MGVPIPPQPAAFIAVWHGHAQEQHQLPGDFHDQCWPIFCCPTHLRGHGDVPSGAATVPTWQSLPIYLWLLRSVSDVPADGDRHSGACRANLLQQEATRCLV